MSSELASAVEALARAGAAFSEQDLAREWSWRAYHEGRRFVYLLTYQELRELAARTAAARNSAPTMAQRALAGHHVAFRDLRGLLVALPDDALDREPAPEEWPLRKVLHHIVFVERAFYAKISHALDLRSRGEPPAELPRDQMRAIR